MNWVIGVLVGSLLSLFATANIPSWLGILVYKLDTSRVHNIAPSGICPRLLIFLMKSWVSLIWDFVCGTYCFICSSTNLLILLVG